ncbi:hypothetical protein [Cytophaga sp. FL35]|uniref:hypothetical protein n=1 Tax=Cytophaga sp. FL35 TaxID=1904456 RepID=UPI0016535C1A|nr:hypothetical protein [Cytophaga sp. FL35]MBC6997675.1 hypothetical protein [Cytophaga sp. FL35]
MKKVLFLLIVPFLFLSACKEEKEQTQMQEVMAIHDEVMPKMSKLGTLVGELNSKENDSTELGLKYREARKDLQAAHKSMMDWMQNFGNRFDPDEILKGKELTDQKQEWLNEEEKKVKDLKEQINSSISNAQQLLGKSE